MFWGGHMLRFVLGLAAAVQLLSVANAEVVSQSATGAAVRHEVSIALKPEEAFGRFVNVSSWWSAEHSFSGDARNISISLLPDGCWCEKMPDGGFVRHMVPILVEPNKRLVFQGQLGPLMFMGVSGSMTVEFTPENEGTHVKLTYVVGGYDPHEFKKIGPLVDKVLGDQLAGFARLDAPAP